MILLDGFLVWRIDLLWWCHEVFLVCISVAAVTATDGSALTAGHFWKESAKSNQKRSAPPLGTSPRLGVPSLRHCSVGRREGPSMAQRGYPGIHAGMPTAQCLRSASVV